MKTDTRVYTRATDAWESINAMEADGWSVRLIVPFNAVQEFTPGSFDKGLTVHFFVVYEKDLT